jgi:hypothetical protein
MKLAACQAAFFSATAHGRLSDSALEDRPVARVLAPAHFACLHGSSLGAQNGVLGLHIELELPAGFRGTSADAAANGLVCVAVDGGPSGSTLAGAHAAQCAALDGNPRDSSGEVVYEALPAPAGLAPGCHVLTAWWQSRDGAEVGSAHPVLFRVPAVPGGACAASCAARAAQTDDGAPAADAVAAYPPNPVTGGCALGDPRCCPEGCCEYVNLASQCSLFADGLPPCGSCLGGTAAPAAPSVLVGLLPDPLGRQAADMYLELVKGAVLDDLTTSIRGPPPSSGAGVHATPGTADAFANAEADAADVAAAKAQRWAEAEAAKVDGHVWPAEHAAALTMVGRRRLNHVHALIDDVVRRVRVLKERDVAGLKIQVNFLFYF